jgi:undecaprenyl diphosphate synthase
MVVEECRRLGVKYITLYAFSSENWKRPEQEVGALMGLFNRYLNSELDKLCESGVRLRSIGDRSKLPQDVVDSLTRAEERTKDVEGMQLILAVSYGGRDEIVSAVKRLAARVQGGELDPSQISEAVFSSSLYTHDIPDPDLLIRTSNEFRLSNFLLWQLAYSEIIVSEVLWPDFTKEELHTCIARYQERERRFGLISEQLPAV